MSSKTESSLRVWEGKYTFLRHKNRDSRKGKVESRET